MRGHRIIAKAIHALRKLILCLSNNLFYVINFSERLKSSRDSTGYDDNNSIYSFVRRKGFFLHSHRIVVVAAASCTDVNNKLISYYLETKYTIIQSGKYSWFTFSPSTIQLYSIYRLHVIAFLPSTALSLACLPVLLVKVKGACSPITSHEISSTS